MVKAIYQAARNMDYKTKNIEIVANNLANMSTVGYKRELPFAELMTRNNGASGTQLSDLSAGNIIATNNSLDVAVSGAGYFVVKNNDGSTGLTKDGRFSISSEGYLETAQHQRVQGQRGDINLYQNLLDKEQVVSITSEGDVKMGDNFVDKFLIGKIDTQQNLVRNNVQDFNVQGQQFGIADQNTYKLSQGYIEESNVNPVVEMESMITLNKDYEAAQKIIGFFDQSLAKASEVGKV
jgi:flagellar basal-body rod protein FlgG